MKTLIITRGLPGSGKSTFAELIAPVSSYETDNYFINSDGEYIFDPSKLSEAHEFTQKEVEGELSLGLHDIVVVSNTFTQEWEIKPYVEMAKKYGFRVVSLIVENRHDGESSHDVPEVVIGRMKTRFDIKL